VRISPEQRQTLTLTYFHGLTQGEIHARTRAPLGTIKGRLRLGLVALHGELADAA
jgi:RNA polymerase sigma-70 factor (ECF subfamily)